jgi:hypothetical protein
MNFLPFLRILAGSSDPKQLAIRVIGLIALVVILVIWGATQRSQNSPVNNPGPLLTVTPLSDIGTLAIGDSVTGSLADDERQSWAFEGQRGQRVNVRVLGDWESTVELLPPEGARAIATDLNLGGADQAIFCNLALPASGTYHVVVGGGLGNSGMVTFGDYTLVLEEENYVEDRQIAYGDTVEGRLTTCDGDFYTLPVKEGDRLQVTLAPEGGAEMYLRLLPTRKDGQLIAFGRDALSADGQAQEIAAVQVLANSTFFIQVAAPYTAPEAGYTLTVGRYEGEATPEATGEATPDA